MHIIGQLGYDATHFLLHGYVAIRLTVGVMMMMMGRRQFGTLPRTYAISLFVVAGLGRHVRRLVCCYFNTFIISKGG